MSLHNSLGMNQAVRTGLAGIVVLALAWPASSQERKGFLSPVQVTIQDEKPVVIEPTLPVEPRQRIRVNTQGSMMLNIRVDNQTMHLGSIQTVFHIDGNVYFPGSPPGRMTVQNQALPRTKAGKARTGFMSVYEFGKLIVTQTVEVVPTKPKTGPRRLDTALVKFLVENKDDRPHRFGGRVYMDVFIVDNDGALFASPRHPGKILDGIELKGKEKGREVPDYLQFLQRPDLENPGFVAHMTYQFGKAFDMPDRIVLTRLGAFANQWDLQPIQAMGDSAMGVYWEPKEIKANARRNIAYGYGGGIAPSPEGDGAVGVVLGGSFEPGKLFSVAAYVQDPSAGQDLTLELPQGMERVEGRERQPVPAVSDGGNTMVLWKARVLRTGRFTLRVRSSNGVTQTKIITISRPGESASGAR